MKLLVSALAAGAVLAGAVAPALAAKAVAKAPNRYDGSWSVEVITENGSCDRAYRYGVVIENGQARYAGGSDFTVSGRVQPNGAVRAVISRGDAAARVVGRLADRFGSGTWTASGSASCAGRWNAERRS
ncbi:hypothetical protein OPKNFCMD_0854 [Methylobacterium crusticola]|uniref:Large exoprotein involved in heme utilization or adhesion n=1 Tax=Methylobacterium crusticola TaxID=1697972 RepID=A0ABQ4QS55_9HYPH|nr:hypothetical protein [Methylobacterium crusticola]GJD48138.1 hypothetical protein OPKNFCMD_0854 [Methylobacterium crusticola]